MKKLILIFIVIVLSGCASSVSVFTPPEPRSGEVGTINVVREKSLSYGARTYYVILDGVPVAALKSGQYTSIRVEAGNHEVGVSCFDGITDSKLALLFKETRGQYLGEWKGVKLSVQVSSNDIETVFFGPGWSTCAKLKSNDDLDLSKYKVVNLGTVAGVRK